MHSHSDSSLTMSHPIVSNIAAYLKVPDVRLLQKVKGEQSCSVGENQTLIWVKTCMNEGLLGIDSTTWPCLKPSMLITNLLFLWSYFLIVFLCQALIIIRDPTPMTFLWESNTTYSKDPTIMPQRIEEGQKGQFTQVLS